MKTQAGRDASWFAIWFLLLPLFAGCSRESGPTCYPVQGKLTYDGRPLKEAMIVFHP